MELEDRLDGLTVVVTALLVSHLAHDVDPRAAAQPLFEVVRPLCPPGGAADREIQRIVAIALDVIATGR